MAGQDPMTRAIVGIEMRKLNRNGIMEFSETPSIEKVRVNVWVVVWATFVTFRVSFMVWLEMT